MLDLLYKTLLTIINKENNGYISPTEFNLLAHKVQLKIFRNYFENENLDKNKENKGLTNRGYANLDFNERQRITQFAAIADITKSSGKFTLPTDIYFIEDEGVTRLDDSDVEFNVVEEVERHQFGYLNRSEAKPTETFPVYESYGTFINVSPATINKIRLRYLRFPKMPNWTYTIVGGKEMFDPSNGSYQDIELHGSEFPNIVVQMLSEFGINLREQEIMQIAERLKEEVAQKDNG